ncbi:MAG: hypothetical protein P1V20_09645, partial [Verrucomicrobiales bacterium]|nr:hypothetical protein [Verrucomicrobiales bacterium]
MDVYKRLFTGLAVSFTGCIGVAQNPVEETLRSMNQNASIEKALHHMDDVLVENQASIDSSWLLSAAVLVCIALAGLCLFETGIVRSRHSINVGLKSMLNFSVALVVYIFLGSSLMYAIGSADWSTIRLEDFQIWQFSANDAVWAFLLFQAACAAFCSAIASGAMAERVRFSGYLIFVALFAGIIYPAFGHWAWGSRGTLYGLGGEAGWLEAMGFHDFAGATVIFGVGGATALAGIMIVGSRINRFRKDGKPLLIANHNIPLAIIGVVILSVGWFGIIGGAHVNTNAAPGRLFVNTAMAGAGGCISGLLLFGIIRGAPGVFVVVNGLIGGLVAVSAGCDVINPLSATVIGAVAGIFASSGAVLIEKLKLDDATGAIPVYLCNGVWGTIAVALFHENGFQIDVL